MGRLFGFVNSRYIFASFVLLAWGGTVAPAISQAPEPITAQTAVADPPAHVSFVDGTAVLERDGQRDSSPLNMPLLAGDRLRTENGRVEILFADNSTLHLDTNTTIDFQSDELVRLLAGRIRLAIPGPDRDVSYRIDAPSASALITQPGEYKISVLQSATERQVELAVLRGSAELVNDGGRTALRAGERAYARADAAPSYGYAFNSASWDAFDRWSETRRDQRMGVSTQYLPGEVQPYASAFDQYG
ncbi:MAG: FecR domain-containing protein, partial [Acidobacteria bacterium]|nr:FecR domain-containing protein [Acidobacteriota bacterium]